MIKKPLAFICMFCVKVVFAQDPVFTLPGSATAYSNAALIDYNTVSTFKTAYRLQWPKLDGGWNQYYSEYSHYVHPIRGYITAYGMYENNYALSRQSYYLNYTSNIRVSKLVSIRAFFGGGYFFKKVDWSVLSFGDMIDPRRGFIYMSNDVPRGGSVGNVDFNAGLGAKISFVTLAVSASHLTQPDESLVKGKSPLPMHFTAQIGLDYDFLVSRQGKLKVLPFFMFNQQGAISTFQYGSVFEVKGIRVGIASRRNDAIHIMAGYNHKFFGINIGYDYTNSELQGLTGGAFETNFVLKMGKNVRELQKSQFDSPFLY
ncbi:MAG TPA: type IX secretion system membrane protein PorP/SprF [Flavobacteriales bacterium]|nr:type IX secretion system membrane protein PorP/SprF [Flavobacteriales bacterium]